MTAVLANVLWPLGFAALMGSVVAGLTERKRECWLLVGTGMALIAVECMLQGEWVGATWNATLAAFFLGRDWWDHKGKRVAKLVGEKSRAILAAVVERAREAGSAPVPQGVRA